MQATLVSNDTTREPFTYSSVIRTLSVLKPMAQDVTCRDEDLSRPRTTENLLSLDPWARERYVRFVSSGPRAGREFHVGNLLRGRIVVPTMSTSFSCSDGLGTVTY